MTLAVADVDPIGLDPIGLAGSAAIRKDWSAWFKPTGEGLCRLELALEGADCAACLGEIERAMCAMPGVRDARVNVSDRRLTLSLEAQRADPDQLIGRLARMGHPARPFDPGLQRQRASAELRRLLTSLAVAAFAAMNVMLLSVSIWSGNVTDITPETRDFFHAISAVIALPAIAVAGRPFFTNAMRGLRGGGMTMDIPISVGVILATGYSLFNTLTHAHEAYFDSALMLLFFLLVGRVLDEVMRRKTSGEAEFLATLRADTAVRVESDGSLAQVPVSALKPGDLILVRPGDHVPCDGTIVTGESEVDASLVNGESVPLSVGPGAALYAGTTNLRGALTLRAAHGGGDGFVDEVERLLRAASQSRSSFRRLSDRVTRAYTPVVHVAALVTFIGWMIAGASWRAALADSIAVLIITCPCALALAIPSVQMVAAGRLFRQRVLLHSGEAIERFAAVDTVVFDKTGTLTLPSPVIVNRAALDEARVRRAGLLARASLHPLAQALAMAAAIDTQTPFLTEDLREESGCGVEAFENGRRLRLGRPGFCGVDAEEAARCAAAYPEASLIAYAEEGAPPVLFALAQDLRPDAVQTIAALRADGYAVEILSGDRTAIVADIAARLGDIPWRAELTPAGKIGRLNELAASGAKVLMVGDGLNDAPALRAAHASLSPMSGTHLAQAAADAIFLGESLEAVTHVLDISRAARRVMTEGLVFALAYNTAAVPIAMFGHASPLVAALAMSGSSLVVTLNALRLRWIRPKRRSVQMLKGVHP